MAARSPADFWEIDRERFDVDRDESDLRASGFKRADFLRFSIFLTVVSALLLCAAEEVSLVFHLVRVITKINMVKGL